MLIIGLQVITRCKSRPRKELSMTRRQLSCFVHIVRRLFSIGHIEYERASNIHRYTHVTVRFVNEQYQLEYIDKPLNTIVYLQL
jgi:hypothetical protein